MIGLVLVTHGNLGREFISVLEEILGPQKQVTAVSVNGADDLEKKREEILQAAKTNDTGDGVILITDMFGGTPSNLAISITQNLKIEALAGMNLPMLIKLASVRQTENLNQAAILGQEAGRKYINAASVLLQAG